LFVEFRESRLDALPLGFLLNPDKPKRGGFFIGILSF